MKENLEINPEGLNCIYMSNIELFKTYKHLYGLTGTIGNEGT